MSSLTMDEDAIQSAKDLLKYIQQFETPRAEKDDIQQHPTTDRGVVNAREPESSLSEGFQGQTWSEYHALKTVDTYQPPDAKRRKVAQVYRAVNNDATPNVLRNQVPDPNHSTVASGSYKTCFRSHTGVAGSRGYFSEDTGPSQAIQASNNMPVPQTTDLPFQRNRPSAPHSALRQNQTQSGFHSGNSPLNLGYVPNQFSTHTRSSQLATNIQPSYPGVLNAGIRFPNPNTPTQAHDSQILDLSTHLSRFPNPGLPPQCNNMIPNAAFPTTSLNSNENIYPRFDTMSEPRAAQLSITRNHTQSNSYRTPIPKMTGESSHYGRSPAANNTSLHLGVQTQTARLPGESTSPPMNGNLHYNTQSTLPPQSNDARPNAYTMPRPNDMTVSDASIAQSGFNSLPNIGIFFNQNQARKPVQETTTDRSETNKVRSAVLNQVGLCNTTIGVTSTTVPSPIGFGRPNGASPNSSWPVPHSPTVAVSAALTPSVSTSSQAARSPSSLYNTRPISARKLPDQTDSSSAYAFRIRFPSSLDLGPIFEPNQFSNSSPSEENSDHSEISWFSDQFFGQVLEELGSGAKSRRSQTSSNRMNRSSRSKSRDKDVKYDRKTLSMLHSNRNVGINNVADKRHYVLNKCKPCKVVLTDIQFYLNTLKTNSGTGRPRSKSEDSSKRTKRNAAKRPCQLSCCNEREHEGERPSLRLKIYRCKPCRVVLENIWPWLQRVKRMQDKKKRKQSKHNHEEPDLTRENMELTDGGNAKEKAESNGNSPREKLLLYICRKCNVSFPTAAECADHLQAVHNKPYFKCSSCLQRFHTEEEFSVHIQSACLPSKSPKSDICSNSPGTLSNSPVSAASTVQGQETITCTTHAGTTQPITQTSPTDTGQLDTAALDSSDHLSKSQGLVIKSNNELTSSKTTAVFFREMKANDNIGTLEVISKDLCQHERDKCGESTGSPKEREPKEGTSDKMAPNHEDCDMKASGGSITQRHWNKMYGQTENKIDDHHQKTYNRYNAEASMETETEVTKVGHETDQNVVDATKREQVGRQIDQRVLNSYGGGKEKVGLKTKEYSNTSVDLAHDKKKLVTFNSAVDNLLLKPHVENMNSVKTSNVRYQADKPETNPDKIHKENERKQKPNGLNETVMVPMYICKKCNVQFQKVSDCSEHLKTAHNKASYFKCSSCATRFLTESEFLTHIESICLPKDSKKMTS